MNYENYVLWQGMLLPTPPPEHPRLYLRSQHVSDLEHRRDHPVMKEIWGRLQQLPDEGEQFRLELDALTFLMEGDAELGRRTAESGLEFFTAQVTNIVESMGSRQIGRMLQTAAVIYDWCYSHFTPEERQLFVQHILALAKGMEASYPPFRQEFIVTHTAEMEVMMYQLSAGVAIYDEHPEMYWICAGRFLQEALPVRNWIYLGHAYHQGDSYGCFRYDCDLHPLWIFDRMGVGNVYHPSQRFVPYRWIYMRRPDGARIRCGDSYKTFTPRGQNWATLGTLLSASYYKDPYIYNEYLKSPDLPDHAALVYFLWRDPDLKPKPETDLPLTRYFGSPFGWMIARTGWDNDCVIAEMKVNEYNFFNHSHEDAGSFQIYYKGALAIDSGIYEGADQDLDPDDEYAHLRTAQRSHRLNYLVRTIAHNSLLIYDPTERHNRGDECLVNDGGQEARRSGRQGWPEGLTQTLEDIKDGPLYRTATVLAHGFGPGPAEPDFTYLKGDITAAYSAKVKEVKRSFVFLNMKNSNVPAVLIVFDKVVASNPDFKKYWLLHSIEEPRISGNEIIITRTEHGERGKLINTTLLPEPDNTEFTTVGGPGKEFWVAGRNFPLEPKPDCDSHERGAWRVELCPKSAEEEDCFLNVMQVMDRETGTPHEVERIDCEKVVGLQIADRAVLFSRDSTVLDGVVDFSVSGSEPLNILVTDLAAGTWQVFRNGTMEIPATEVSESDGVLVFSGKPGNYQFVR